MGRPRKLVILLGAAAAGAAVVAVVRHVARHRRGAATGQGERGGILIGDAAAYDAMSRLFFGSLFGPIAADVGYRSSRRSRRAPLTWLARAPEAFRPTSIRPIRPRLP